MKVPKKVAWVLGTIASVVCAELVREYTAPIRGRLAAHFDVRRGLQITIRQTSPQLTFQVELHNTGKETVNLDHPLKNSADYYTLGLQFIDQQDKKRWLAQRKSGCDERVTKCYYVGILQAGYAALLQPGETYSFSVDLRNFNLPHTPGRYTLQAIYTHDFSEPAVFPSRVTSNSVPFTISAP